MMIIVEYAIKLINWASNPTTSLQLEGGVGTMIIVGFGVVTIVVFYRTVLLVKRNSI